MSDLEYRIRQLELTISILLAIVETNNITLGKLVAELNQLKENKDVYNFSKN